MRGRGEVLGNRHWKGDRSRVTKGSGRDRQKVERGVRTSKIKEGQRQIGRRGRGGTGCEKQTAGDAGGRAEICEVELDVRGKQRQEEEAGRAPEIRSARERPGSPRDKEPDSRESRVQGRTDPAGGGQDTPGGGHDTPGGGQNTPGRRRLDGRALTGQGDRELSKSHKVSACTETHAPKFLTPAVAQVWAPGEGPGAGPQRPDCENRAVWGNFWSFNLRSACPR